MKPLMTPPSSGLLNVTIRETRRIDSRRRELHGNIHEETSDRFTRTDACDLRHGLIPLDDLPLFIKQDNPFVCLFYHTAEFLLTLSQSSLRLERLRDILCHSGQDISLCRLGCRKSHLDHTFLTTWVAVINSNRLFSTQGDFPDFKNFSIPDLKDAYSSLVFFSFGSSMN